MSERKVIQIGPHTLSFPEGAQVKVGATYTEAEAIAISKARAAEAAPASLERRIEQAKAALSPDGPDEAVRERAKAVEAKMVASRRALGRRPAADDAESVANRAAATRRALGL